MGKQWERKVSPLTRIKDTKANGQVFPSTGSPFCTTQKMPRFFQSAIALAVLPWVLLTVAHVLAQHCRNWENMKAVLLTQSQSSPDSSQNHEGQHWRGNLQSNTAAALVSCQPGEKLVEAVAGVTSPHSLPNHLLNTFLFWHLEHPVQISSTIPCHSVWTSTSPHLCRFWGCTLPSIAQYCSSYSALCQPQLWQNLPPSVPFPGGTVSSSPSLITQVPSPTVLSFSVSFPALQCPLWLQKDKHQWTKQAAQTIQDGAAAWICSIT